MRSGSTLLKSLIATAPDTSHLPEFDFQRYSSSDLGKLKNLSSARIVVLKKPAWYTDSSYPKIPLVPNSRKIVLVRDVFSTVDSLHKMNEITGKGNYSDWNKERIAEEYWASVYGKLKVYMETNPADTLLVKYEELIRNPVSVTKELFEFIGSEQKEGVLHYKKPTSYTWKWFNDDGGEKIKSLKVQSEPEKKRDKDLEAFVNSSQKISGIRSFFGYK